MKKMFFTAIALVAFSGVSVANTKEEVKDEIIKITPCQEYALEEVNALEEEFGCMTSAEYNTQMNYYISKCESH